MNTKYIVPILAIVLIVSVSGCTGMEFPGLKNLFGTGTSAIEESADIITIDKIDVIPTPPITAENEFSLSYILKNQDTKQSINNVIVKLYNWGICSPNAALFTPEGWTLDKGIYYKNFEELVPLQGEGIEWSFNAPNNNKIGNIEADCPIKWEVDYVFSAMTHDDFAVISRERQREFDRSGQAWEGTDSDQRVGIGPVKVYFDWKTPMPLQSNSSIQFSLQVADRGTGIYPAVEAKSMKLKIPASWIAGLSEEDKADPCNGKFQAEGTTSSAGSGTGSNINANVILATEDGYVVYENVNDITLIKRESPEIICRFKAPDLDGAGLPEQSYFVTANITDYTYKMTADETVSIKPSV